MTLTLDDIKQAYALAGITPLVELTYAQRRLAPNGPPVDCGCPTLALALAQGFRPAAGASGLKVELKDAVQFVVATYHVSKAWVDDLIGGVDSPYGSSLSDDRPEFEYYSGRQIEEYRAGFALGQQVRAWIGEPEAS